MTQAASFFLASMITLMAFSVKRSNMAFIHHLSLAGKLIFKQLCGCQLIMRTTGTDLTPYGSEVCFFAIF